MWTTELKPNTRYLINWKTKRKMQQWDADRGQKREMWLIIKSNCVAINSSYHYWDLLSQYSWSSFAWREDYFHMWLRCNYLHPQAAEISELKCWLPGWECAATPHMTAPCLRGSSSHVSSCPAKTERKRGTSIITVTYTSLSVFTYIRRTTVGGNVFEWCRCSKKILIIFQSSMKRDKETVECHECQSGKKALNKLNFLWFIFDVWYVLKVRRKKNPSEDLTVASLASWFFRSFIRTSLSQHYIRTHSKVPDQRSQRSGSEQKQSPTQQFALIMAQGLWRLLKEPLTRATGTRPTHRGEPGKGTKEHHWQRKEMKREADFSHRNWITVVSNMWESNQNSVFQKL